METILRNIVYYTVLAALSAITAIQYTSMTQMLSRAQKTVIVVNNKTGEPCKGKSFQSTEGVVTEYPKACKIVLVSNK